MTVFRAKAELRIFNYTCYLTSVSDIDSLLQTVVVVVLFIAY